MTIAAASAIWPLPRSSGGDKCGSWRRVGQYRDNEDPSIVPCAGRWRYQKGERAWKMRRNWSTKTPMAGLAGYHGAG
ncbi:MAG: hypothetical protein U0401_00545 [Anaerolineae bacterium]